MTRREIARAVLTGAVLWSALGTSTGAETLDVDALRPVPISPGGRGQEGEVGTACPTFSWAAIEGAAGYEVVVYVSNGGLESSSREEPVLRIDLPAGVSSWTPELREGLASGRYAWAVGAHLRQGGPPRWSQPALFRVTLAAPARDREVPPRREASVALGSAVFPPPSTTSSFEPPGLRSLTDEAYVPPVCGSGKFADVPAGSAFCSWIEQLDRDGIMTSCDGGSNFCPKNPVTREQLAMVLGKSTRGTATWHPAEGSNWLAPPAGNLATTIDDAGDVGQHTSITIGVDGLPIISYYDATATALKVAHCNDVACAMPATITTVDNSGSVGQYTSITIGEDGLPIISYYDATIDVDLGVFNQALKVAHCNDVSCAGQDETITIVHDANDAVGLYSSIAIGRDGSPIISYYNFGLGALLVARCGNVPCTSAPTISTVEPSGVAEGNTSITIDIDGFPIISYVASGTLKVVDCNNVWCSDVSFNLAVSPAAGDGGTSIAIGTDGLPIVAYKNGSGLWVAHCNYFGCFGSSETVSPVNTPVGNSVSLTIGADGLPIASLGSSNVYVTRCNDRLCADQDEAATPIESGQYSSITIGVDGLPIVSYYDAGASALKVLHCANVFCAPAIRRR